MIWQPVVSLSLRASRTQLRQTIPKHRVQNFVVRSYASAAATAHRQYRDVASILDSPLNKDPTPRPVQIVAHVQTVRAQKRRAFVALNDGSTARPLQVLLDPAQAVGLVHGTSVRIRGAWAPSPAQGQSHELIAEQIEILGPADETYPIQKKYMTAEYLRTVPHLRVRTTTQGLLARLRSDCEHHVSTHFRNDGFIRLHPPAITSSDCEGAGEVFTVKPRDSHPPETASEDDQTKPHGDLPAAHEEFFRGPKYLTVSNQLHLEAFVHEHQRVWALAPTFRAERSMTPRHLSEFYMLEAEIRCSDLGQVMDVVEALVKNVTRSVEESSLGKEMLSKQRHAVDEEHEEARLSLLATRYRGIRSAYWPRITYTQAVGLLKQASEETLDLFKFTPTWQEGLQLEHEKYIASTVGNGSPVFVTDYPKHQKPFYMLPTHVPAAETEEVLASDATSGGQRWQQHTLPAKPTMEQHLQEAHPTVACFDLLLPDMGELVGGSLREHRLAALETVMQERGLTNLDWYVDLRKYGSVPHGGFGLGFDRLLMYLSGVNSVRDVVQWPRYYGRCDA